jgi:hypothetical protein
MTNNEQAIFIDQLVHSVKSDLVKLATSGKLPEDWDGTELRWLIADKFADVVIGGAGKASKRKREYKNTCLVNNL